MVFCFEKEGTKDEVRIMDWNIAGNRAIDSVSGDCSDITEGTDENVYPFAFGKHRLFDYERRILADSACYRAGRSNCGV